MFNFQKKAFRIKKLGKFAFSGQKSGFFVLLSKKNSVRPSCKSDNMESTNLCILAGLLNNK